MPELGRASGKLGVLPIPRARLPSAFMSLRQHCWGHEHFPQENDSQLFQERRPIAMTQQRTANYPLVMSFLPRGPVPADESLPHSFPSDLFLVTREMGEMRDCLKEVNEPTGCFSRDRVLSLSLCLSSRLEMLLMQEIGRASCRERV